MLARHCLIYHINHPLQISPLQAIPLQAHPLQASHPQASHLRASPRSFVPPAISLRDWVAAGAKISAIAPSHAKQPTGPAIGSFATSFIFSKNATGRRRDTSAPWYFPLSRLDHASSGYT